MQMFVDGLAHQWRDPGPRAELVLVEWNPPPDRPSLAEALSWPRSAGISWRIVHVPSDLHDRYEGGSGVPLLQMIAKNAAIRRARGRWVLATNVDVLLSNELAAHLRGSSLDALGWYRTDRFDVPAVPPPGRLDERLAWCERNVVGVNGTAVASPRERALSALSFRRRRADNARRPLHTAAAGDFTLLARDAWFALRGYAEVPGHGTHVDALLCYAASCSGMSERRLGGDMRIFHVEHARRAPAPQSAGGSEIDAAHKDRLIREMQASRRPWIPNDDAWGLAEYDLDETTIG